VQHDAAQQTTHTEHTMTDSIIHTATQFLRDEFTLDETHTQLLGQHISDWFDAICAPEVTAGNGCGELSADTERALDLLEVAMVRGNAKALRTFFAEHPTHAAIVRGLNPDVVRTLVCAAR